MAHLIEHLRQLVSEQNWTAILNHESAAVALSDPLERARALYMMSHARWRRGKDPFDYAQSVRFAREAAALSDLQGRALHWLGTCLVTIGRYREGRHVLQRWIARFQDWSPEVQSGMGDVQYALGYAARYERDLPQAALWYRVAYDTHRQNGNTTGAAIAGYGLAKVLVRQNQVKAARSLINEIHPVELNAYYLAVLAEILAAEGDIAGAVNAGETASVLLLDLDDSDPWELAELHLFLATLQYQAGPSFERDKHLALAMDALATSPRHDLYAAACLLLDSDRTEVNMG